MSIKFPKERKKLSMPEATVKKMFATREGKIIMFSRVLFANDHC